MSMSLIGPCVHGLELRCWELTEPMGDDALWEDVGLWGVTLKGTVDPWSLPFSFAW
jgi:hypothetical protein